nr:GNAT family N-acetyltransferase [Microvirga puerhi]
MPSSKENEELLQRIGYRRRHTLGWHSAQIDLGPSEEEIFRGFSSTFRNLSRRAEKQDLTLELSNNPEAIDWLIGNYSDRMSALGVKHGDHAFFRALATSAGCEFFLLRAMLNREPVGGTALIHAGRVSEYNVAWHHPSARSLNVGHYLIWNAIREAKRRGALVFDVGGLAGVESGFSTFKRALHGKEYQLLDEHISI